VSRGTLLVPGNRRNVEEKMGLPPCPGNSRRTTLLMSLRKFTQSIVSMGMAIVNQYSKVVYTSGKISQIFSVFFDPGWHLFGL
jgi:hypothetical protein